jgi:hypothetical protein
MTDQRHSMFEAGSEKRDCIGSESVIRFDDSLSPDGADVQPSYS